MDWSCWRSRSQPSAAATAPTPADSDASVADGQPPPVLEVRREGAAVTDLRFGSLSVGSDAVLTVAVHNLSPAAVTVDAAVTSSSLRDWPAPCCLVA